ncbi:MAG: type III-A CRISPR-associated RAMP protein Csm4 [Bacteroidetes bacterium SW_10_40_5]|nr:MAG: type III-A CRISPR-associated RAMP protein Csm4 [Bacteroidetes bacterium SW_10_40_5]
MSALEFEVAKLNFTTPLHISSGKENVFDVSGDILHSDQVKGALFVTAKQLYGDEIDGSFMETFTISSAFPYWGQSYFFPKPMMRLPLRIEGVTGESKQSKQLKKLQYIEKGWMEKVMATGENGELIVRQNQLSANNTFLWDQAENSDQTFMKKEVQERVSIPDNREEEDPTPYFMERIYFDDHAGLFFLLQWQQGISEHQKEQVRAAFKLLGDSGVGTDRNVGNGQFNIDWDNISFNIPDNADKMMATGLFCPKAGSIEEGAYRHYRKKWVYMFSEGSVFPNDKGLEGNIVDLCPEDANITHPVWRDGTCLFLPLKA